MSQTFRWPVRVYWEDTDAGGIVFYANYLKFFERARTEWLRSLGLEQQRLREQTGGLFVVTETALRYHRPARLDDLLQVSARVTELGRASMTLQQKARLLPPHSSLADPGAAAARAAEALEPAVAELLCDASIRIGWVDAATLRPLRLPPALVHLLNQS
ncbi:tol-pal system-associated acyl-CoA thioesterase [Serpentinimonas raichei]|uniref:tol-pal system-associated acyl-CoA thioesterase n=1 Tax=Serpentinimonas raichei TaxID=1458425 RepID=UPI0005ED97CC|nr:tol-pal system-associated acyl-CoA thioesterase [Serpentinimonas raichei]